MRYWKAQKRILSIALSAVMMLSFVPTGIVVHAQGHNHTEDCYAKGGELICGLDAVSLLDDSVPVSTADELRDALATAEDGERIELGADINIDCATVKTIMIDKEITISHIAMTEYIGPFTGSKNKKA